MCNCQGVSKEVSVNKVCGECGEINYDGVNFCQDCGAMLADFKYVFCEICGTKNEINNEACKECKIKI